MQAERALAPTREAAADLVLPLPENALGEPHIRVRLHGDLRGPLVVVAGGISAHRIVCGDGGWWNGVAGEGAALDTRRFCTLGFDFAPAADRRAPVTPARQAELLLHALDALGFVRAHAFVGASYGGMVGLALAALASERVERLCVISAAHKPAPLASAWRGVQRRIVEEALARGEARAGLSLARQLAMITYRSGAEFAARFDPALDANGRSALDRYLVARGDAFAETAQARRWLALSEAIDRCGVDPARIATPTTLVACPTDQLVPLADMRNLAQSLPHCRALRLLPSIYGHDAFLKEPVRLGAILREALA